MSCACYKREDSLRACDKREDSPCASYWREDSLRARHWREDDTCDDSCLLHQASSTIINLLPAKLKAKVVGLLDVVQEQIEELLPQNPPAHAQADCTHKAADCDNDADSDIKQIDVTSSVKPGAGRLYNTLAHIMVLVVNISVVDGTC